MLSDERIHEIADRYQMLYSEADIIAFTREAIKTAADDCQVPYGMLREEDLIGGGDE